MPRPTKSGRSARRRLPAGANPRMLAEVAAGLSAPQKELPPKYFYDQRGSELFEEITRLPEYYPTRTERALLEDWMPELMARLGNPHPGRARRRQRGEEPDHPRRHARDRHRRSCTCRST